MSGTERRILGIDDCRELGYCDLLARTVDEGIAAIIHLGPWDEIHLDHDINRIKSNFHPVTGREMTGYDVVVFLEENPRYLPGKVVLVTGNPVGREKMLKVLKKLYGEQYNGY